MSAPIGLTIKNNLSDMQIGDCIICKYVATTSGSAGVFSELGTSTSAEIQLTGASTPNGLFYFIKVDKGTLIADRNIQNSISWDTLNTAKYLEGKTTALELNNVLIRSISGGVAYLDASGNETTTNNNLGAYPSKNEWDKYIVNSDLTGKIIKGDNNIWHWNNNSSYCIDATSNGFVRTPFSYTVTNSTVRTIRGVSSETNGGIRGIGCVLSNDTSSSWGFRPVLNYIESDIASEVIY
jgi:hypothetical protein